MTTNPTTFQEFLEAQLADPDFRAAYEDAQARERLIDCLVQVREAQHLTQTAVGQAMGVRQSTVSGFENEGSDPRLSTVQRYARALGGELCFKVRFTNADDWSEPRYSRSEATVRTCEVVPIATARNWTSRPSQWHSA